MCVCKDFQHKPFCFLSLHPHVFLWVVDQTCLDSNVHSGVMFQTWKCLGRLSQLLICCLLHCTLPLGTHARSRLGLCPCCTLWHGCRAEHIILRKYNAEPVNHWISFSNLYHARFNQPNLLKRIFLIFCVSNCMGTNEKCFCINYIFVYGHTVPNLNVELLAVQSVHSKA